MASIPFPTDVPTFKFSVRENGQDWNAAIDIDADTARKVILSGRVESIYRPGWDFHGYRYVWHMGNVICAMWTPGAGFSETYMSM